MAEDFLGKLKWRSVKIVIKFSPTPYLARVGDRLWHHILIIDHILPGVMKLPGKGLP